MADTVLHVWKRCSINSIDRHTSRVTVSNYSNPVTHKQTLLLHIQIICMHLWASLYTLIRLNGTSITFVLVLFLRKRRSCLVARAAYHASGNASGVGKRFAHERFANTQLLRTCSLTPPSNRLSFAALGASRGCHA